MALTQFHCVLLYRDRVEAICVLNQERVFEDIYNIRRDGALHALCMDPLELKMYTYQKHKVWTYTPFNETRDIWKIYLEQKNYEMAKRYAIGNREHMDIILVSQAEHYFKDQRYQDAALTFSQSQLSFEEVALKFLQVNRKDALKIFLLKKLESLAPSDSTQQTMLTTWLVELFLNDLGTLKDEGDREGHAKMTQEFHSFLETKSLRECLEANAKTVYDLLSSHGAVEDVVFFAMLMKDYERVITHHIRQGKYVEALRVLHRKGSEALEAPEKV
ncbi:Vacuolar protein sorting-associated protein 18 homolog, partial [Geodia barretti]